MKAVWYTRQGPAVEVLNFGEQPTPHAGPGEVRVRLYAAADVMRRNLSIHGVLLNAAPLAARRRAQADIVRWLKEGGMLHTVSSVHALPRTADAHLAVESGTKRGTVVVDCTALNY